MGTTQALTGFIARWSSTVYSTKSSEVAFSTASIVLVFKRMLPQIVGISYNLSRCLPKNWFPYPLSASATSVVSHTTKLINIPQDAL